MNKKLGMTFIEVLVAMTILGIVLITSSVIFATTFTQINSAGMVSQKTNNAKKIFEKNIANPATSNEKTKINLFSDSENPTTVFGKVKHQSIETGKNRDNLVTFTANRIVNTGMTKIAVTCLNGKQIKVMDNTDTANIVELYQNDALSTIYGNPRKKIEFTFDKNLLVGTTITVSVLDGKNNNLLNSSAISANTTEVIIPNDLNTTVENYETIKLDLAYDEQQLKPGKYRIKFEYKDDIGNPTKEPTLLVYNVIPIGGILATDDNVLITEDNDSFYEIDEKNNSGQIITSIHGGDKNPFFVIGGENGYLKYSNDGLKWKSVNSSQLYNENIKKIVIGGSYNNKIFLAMSENKLFISYDNDNDSDNNYMKWSLLKGLTKTYGGGAVGKYGIYKNDMDIHTTFTDIAPVMYIPKENNTGSLMTTNPNSEFYIVSRDIRKKASYMRLRYKVGSWRMVKCYNSVAGDENDKIILPSFKIDNKYRNILMKNTNNNWKEIHFLNRFDGNDIGGIKNVRIYDKKNVLNGELSSNSSALNIANCEDKIFIYLGSNKWLFGLNDETNNKFTFSKEEDMDNYAIDEIDEISNNREITNLTINPNDNIVATVTDIFTNDNPSFYEMHMVVENGKMNFSWDKLNTTLYESDKSDGYVDLDSYSINDIAWR